MFDISKLFDVDFVLISTDQEKEFNRIELRLLGLTHISLIS